MLYQLRPGLSYCRTGGRLVFFDSDKDRYFALAPECQATFDQLARGEPLAEADRSRLQALEHEILVRSGGSPLIESRRPSEVTGTLWDEAGPASAGAVLTALLALTRARGAIRAGRLAALLEQLRSRKAGLQQARHREPTSARRVAAAFKKASSWLSTHDQCLPHSLAIADCLFRRGVAATLVIGVLWGPFRAHCWVQLDDLLVNDRVDLVRDFTPILVI